MPIASILRNQRENNNSGGGMRLFRGQNFSISGSVEMIFDGSSTKSKKLLSAPTEAGIYEISFHYSNIRNEAGNPHLYLKIGNFISSSTSSVANQDGGSLLIRLGLKNPVTSTSEMNSYPLQDRVVCYMTKFKTGNADLVFTMNQDFPMYNVHGCMKKVADLGG
jgi:hypothetical protein